MHENLQPIRIFKALPENAVAAPAFAKASARQAAGVLQAFGAGRVVAIIQLVDTA